MNKLSLVAKKNKESDIVKQLATVGIEAAKNEPQEGSDLVTYRVKHLSTGATLQTSATEKDLKFYLTGVQYVKKTHGQDIEKGFYTKSAIRHF